MNQEKTSGHLAGKAAGESGKGQRIVAIGQPAGDNYRYTGTVMKHVILGAGAIGGLVATGLSSLGEDVSLIVRHGKLGGHPTVLTSTSPTGAIAAPVKLASHLTEPAEVLWIATKTYQLSDALASVEVIPRIIVPLLNGVDHIAVLRARYGHDRIIPATIAVEAERQSQGHYIHHTPVRLNLAGSGEPMLGDVITRLQGLGWHCRFVANEATLMWSKLCFLEPFALVTSASGKNNGEIQADPEWKAKLDAAVREVCTVATKEGAEVDANKVLTAYPNSPPTMRASMAKDLAARRRLELDGIAGPVLRAAFRHGIKVPTTSSLVGIIEESEKAREI
jgi:2-dehydropantoate 2-reductase